MSISKSYSNDIFKKWLKLADNKILRKRYKEWVTKSTTPGLTFEETVKNLDYFLVCKIQFQEKSAEIESREPKHIVPIDNVNSKGPYYEFKQDIEFEYWKGKPFVKFFKSLKPYNCPECSGNGYHKCSCDNGLQHCVQCKGRTSIDCSHCSGTGERFEKIQVIDGLTSKKKNTDLTSQCSICFGASIFTCPNCSGIGKTGHGKCNFTGKLRCKKCNGSGQLVAIVEEPVPIKPINVDLFITGTKNEHDDIVDAIAIKKFAISKLEIFKSSNIKIKELETLILEPNKSHNNFLKNINKQLKSIIKNVNEEIVEPITFYSGLKLICKSTKGRSFEIWSIGETNDFEVIAVGLS